MDSLKTYDVKVTYSPRKCTCVGCKQPINPKSFHVRIYNFYRGQLKLCRACLDKYLSIIDLSEMKLRRESYK